MPSRVIQNDFRNCVYQLTYSRLSLASGHYGNFDINVLGNDTPLGGTLHRVVFK